MVRKIKSHKAPKIFLVVLLLNFLLFTVKLYVGLSSNSISIYSDGINNLFDGLSAAAGIISVYILSKSRDLSFSSRSEKTEQLLSFVLSAVILITGFLFCFNSLERLMYPAPVWFTVSYFYIIAVTAAVKLLMFVFLRNSSRKNASPVVKVMSLDSLTDFFITFITLVTMVVSQKGGISLDAYAGILVSILILISGARSFRESLGCLICFPDKSTRQKAEEILCGYTTDTSFIEFSFSAEKKLLLKTDIPITQDEEEKLKQQLKEETDFNLYLLK